MQVLNPIITLFFYQKNVVWAGNHMWMDCKVKLSDGRICEGILFDDGKGKTVLSVEVEYAANEKSVIKSR